MRKKDLFNYFLSVPNPDKNGQMKREKNFSKKYNELYKEFCSFEFTTDLESSSFTQKLWHFLQDDHGNMGLCKHCGKRSKFISFTNGYQTYCSTKCSNKDETSLEKRTTSQIQRHGGVGFSSNTINKKIKDTMVKKYGVEYTSMSDKLKEKIKTTTINNFGGIGFASKKISSKISETMNTKYGVEYSMQSSEIIEKRRMNKVLANDEFIYIDDETYAMRCGNKDCALCSEKQFYINRNTYGTRVSRGHELCTKLNPVHKQTSCAEQSLNDYIRSIYSGVVVNNDRQVLDGKELDIYLPDIKIGFEFNGDYWHSNPDMHISTDTMHGKTSVEIWNSIIKKEYLANVNGISLYNIWEHDWQNSNGIRDFIKYVIDNTLKKTSSYFKIKTFIQSLDVKYSETKLGEFVFDNAIIKYIDCKYFNDFTCTDMFLKNTSKRVIYIYDFEINDNMKFDILKSCIRHALGMTKTRIFARKCVLKEITNKDAKPFLEENSLFGHRNAKITLGLFYNDELVMVYSFGHNFYGRKNDIEVIRVCTKKNTVVIGGSSKCLDYFLKNYSNLLDNHDLIFYVDRIHQDGNSLKNFEFIRHEYGVMNYWLKDYNGKELSGIHGTAFNRMPSKHHEIKRLVSQHLIAPVKTMGVDVWKYQK